MTTNNTMTNNNNNKMRGLLKGLRYISQIFEDEKDDEMQIGHPTDVKHVAHIGWVGQSTDSSKPSWMNEFKSPASEALYQTVETRKEQGATKCGSKGTTQAKESTETRKATRRNSSDMREKLERPRRRSASSKTSEDGSEIHRKPRRPKDHHNYQDGENTSNTHEDHPDVPKKTHCKKNRDDPSVDTGPRRPKNKEVCEYSGNSQTCERRQKSKEVCEYLATSQTCERRWEPKLNTPTRNNEVDQEDLARESFEERFDKVH